MLHGMRRVLLPPLILIPLIASHADTAAAAPRCTPLREGEVACLDGKLCDCRHHPGGSLTGQRAGTRWNCGALRPACGGAVPPPEAGQSQQPSPFLPPPPPSAWR